MNFTKISYFHNYVEGVSSRAKETMIRRMSLRFWQLLFDVCQGGFTCKNCDREHIMIEQRMSWLLEHGELCFHLRGKMIFFRSRMECNSPSNKEIWWHRFSPWQSLYRKLCGLEKVRLVHLKTAFYFYLKINSMFIKQAQWNRI